MQYALSADPLVWLASIPGIHWKGFRMSNHIYKKIEITGTSEKSSDDAVRNALTRASESVKHMRWFEVTETRGDIDSSNGDVNHWQVTVKIGFTLDKGV
jgi:flavin-binding protein dodecin